MLFIIIIIVTIAIRRRLFRNKHSERSFHNPLYDEIIDKPTASETLHGVELSESEDHTYDDVLQGTEYLECGNMDHAAENELAQDRDGKEGAHESFEEEEANEIPGHIDQTCAVIGDHHYEQMRIFDVSQNSEHAYESVPNMLDPGGAEQVTNIPGRAQVYERVLGLSTTESADAGLYEGAQVYERASNVNIAPMLSGAGIYVRAQVPNVNIAQILSNAGVYERAEVYERVPSVNIAQILSDASVREGGANVSIPLDATGTADGESSKHYESVQYGEKTLQLIRGVMQPYEQISGYERVHYSETMELIWRTIFGKESVEPDYEHARYERVQYSIETMQLLRWMPHVAISLDNESMTRTMAMEESSTVKE